ncbi:MAG TPA: DUF3014 domain-containing protein [Gaiellales bacterium]|nr:DUF3014 domain-containing protein [Gaiellales bacterium]
MATLDDQPIRERPEPTFAPFRPQGPPLGAALIGVLVVLAVAAGAWWWWRGRAVAPAEVAKVAAPAAVERDVAPTSGLVVPALDALDPFMRDLLGPLSPGAEAAKWLQTDGLAAQLAAGIARVASGISPARDLSVLRPAGPFTTERRGRREVIAAASYRRYDSLASTVAAVDATRVAQAYRVLAPRLQEAYDRQGRPGSVDAMLREGLDALVETPIPDGPIEVRQGRGNSWVFADPKLEALSSAQKQLLRMGPDNARAVQQRLREIRAAIGPTT